MSSQAPDGRPSREPPRLSDERQREHVARLLDGPAHTPVIRAPAKTIDSMYAKPSSESPVAREPVDAHELAHQQEQNVYSEAQAAGRAAMYSSPEASFLSNNGSSSSAVRRKPAPANIKVHSPPRVDKQAERGAGNHDANGNDIGARTFQPSVGAQQPTVAAAAPSKPHSSTASIPAARPAAPTAQRDPPTEYEILKEGYTKVKAWSNQRRDAHAQQKLARVPQDGYMPSQAVPGQLPAPMHVYIPPGAVSNGPTDGGIRGAPGSTATPSLNSTTTSQTGKSTAAAPSKSYFDPLRKVIQRKLDGSTSTGGISKPKHKPASTSPNSQAGKSSKAAQLQSQADGVTWATLNNIVHKPNDDVAAPKRSNHGSRGSSRDKINSIYAAYAAQEEMRRNAEHEAQLQRRKAAISRPDSRDGEIGAAAVFGADRFNAVHRNKELPPQHLAEPPAGASDAAAGTKHKQASSEKNLVHVVVNDGSEHRPGQRRGTTLGDFINHNPKQQKTAPPPVPAIPAAAFHLPFGSNNKTTAAAAATSANPNATHSKGPSAGSNKVSEKTNSSSHKHTHSASGFLAKFAAASGSHHHARKDSTDSDMSFKCAGIAEEEVGEDALLAPEQIVAREKAGENNQPGGSSGGASEGRGGAGTSVASSSTTGKQAPSSRQRTPEVPSRLQVPPSQGYRHHVPQPQNIPYPGGSQQPLHRKPVVTSYSSRTQPSAPSFPPRKKAKSVNCGHTDYSASGETEGDYWLCDECKSGKPSNPLNLTPCASSVMQKKPTKSLWAELVPEPLRWVKMFKFGNGDGGGGEVQGENVKKKNNQAQQSAWPKDITATTGSAGVSSSAPFSYHNTPSSSKRQPKFEQAGSGHSANTAAPHLSRQALKPPPPSAQKNVLPQPPIGLGLTNVPLPSYLGSTTPSSSYYPTDPSTALRSTHNPVAPSASIRKHANAPSMPHRAVPPPPAPRARSPPRQRQRQRPLSSPSSISSPIGQDISFLTHRNRESLLMDATPRKNEIPPSFPSPPPIPDSPGDWRARIRNRRRSSMIHVDLSTLGGGPHGGLQGVSNALRSSSLYSPHPRYNNYKSGRDMSVAIFTDPGNPWETMSAIGEEKQENKRDSPVSPVNSTLKQKTVRKDGFTFMNYGGDVSPVSPASPLVHPLQQKQMQSARALAAHSKADRKSWWRPDRANPGKLVEISEPRMGTEDRNTAFYGFYEEILRGLGSPESPSSRP